MQLLEAGRDVVLSAMYVSASVTAADEIELFLDDALDAGLKKLIAKVGMGGCAGIGRLG